MLQGAGPCDRRAVLKILLSLLSKDERLCLAMLCVGAVKASRRRGGKK